MDLPTISMLLAAGVFGGALAGLVGGASLITFPVLLAADLPPIIANASNQAAVLPANIVAGFADRALMPRFDRAFVGLVLVSVCGTIVGSALLLLTPGRTFEVLVPVLLGFATVLFAFSPHLSEWLRARAKTRGRSEGELSVTSLPILLPISIYGGYFGAGVGVMLLAVLAVTTAGNYRTANATKNLISGITTAATVLYFTVSGAISWPQTLVMMAGAALGGLLGGRLARIAPPAVMRVVVVVIGAALTVAYAWRYWF